VQMAHAIDARVIGTASSEEKAQLAREAGADEVIVSPSTILKAEVKRLTDGKGVEVVYDGVGKATFEKNLNVMRLRGMLVLYGMSSGPVLPVDPAKAVGERVALHGAHHSGAFHRHARGIAGAHQRALRHDRGRKAQTPDCEDVSAGGRPAGAHRPGSS